MTNTTYALINNGVVQQVLTTDQDITTLFAPGLLWVPVGAATGVVPGYLFDGSNFSAPPSNLSLSQLQAQLAALQAAMTALSAAP